MILFLFLHFRYIFRLAIVYSSLSIHFIHAYFYFVQMSRIIGPSRYNRGMKQSILFSQNPPPSNQQTPSFALSAQEDVYNQFNAAISNSSNQNSYSPQRTQSNVPYSYASQSPQPSQSKRTRSRVTSSQPEQIHTDYNSGTMTLPENFSTVSISPTDISNIQAINNNAYHRDLSSTMYEDTSSHDSNYKRTVISNMAKDVLNTAAYLCKASENETRTYENQVNSVYDSSYGAHRMNMLAAQRIISQNNQED